MVDRPDLTRESDDVSGVANELERGRPVQLTQYFGEGAVALHSHERTGVGQRRIARHGADRFVQEIMTTA